MSTESTKDDAPERRAKLSPAKQALLEKRLRGKSAGGAKSPIIPRRTERSSVPLSFAQQRLWFLDQLQPGSPFYNVPKAVRLKGALDVEALHRTLEALIARHESLRTTFATVGASPVQVIAPTSRAATAGHDLSRCRRVSTTRRRCGCRGGSARPFDLARGPLARATLIRLGQEDHVLLLTMPTSSATAGPWACCFVNSNALRSFSQGSRRRSGSFHPVRRLRRVAARGMQAKC